MCFLEVDHAPRSPAPRFVRRRGQHMHRLEVPRNDGHGPFAFPPDVFDPRAAGAEPAMAMMAPARALPRPYQAHPHVHAHAAPLFPDGCAPINNYERGHLQWHAQNQVGWHPHYHARYQILSQSSPFPSHDTPFHRPHNHNHNHRMSDSVDAGTTSHHIQNTILLPSPHAEQRQGPRRGSFVSNLSTSTAESVRRGVRLIRGRVGEIGRRVGDGQWWVGRGDRSGREGRAGGEIGGIGGIGEGWEGDRDVEDVRVRRRVEELLRAGERGRVGGGERVRW